MRLAGRLGAMVVLSAALFGATSLLASPAAFAHPLGNFTINHYTGLVVTPGHVRLTYALDMAEIPTFQQSSAIDANGDGTITQVERSAWAKAETRTLAPMLVLTVDGRALTLSNRCGSSMVFRPGQGGLPILRLVSVFDAPAPPSGSLAFRDRTFADRIGWKEITATAGPGTSLSRATVPATTVSDELLKYPTNLLQSPLSVTQASASYASSGSSPEPACPGTATGSPKAAGSAFASLITRKVTPALLGASLLLAFAFGVLHALGPGHGKTITAAYLVGSGAKLRQAVGVGVAVASMHTLSVLGLGALAVVLSASFPAERIYPWLTVATGVVALILGCTLLAMRVRALRRGRDAHGHSHPWDGEQHDHGERLPDGSHHDHPGVEDGAVVRELALVGAGVRSVGDPGAGSAGADRHDHHRDHGEHGAHGTPAHVRAAVDDPSPSGSEPVVRSGAVSRPKLAALAVSGGLLPSPTALVVMLAAIGAHRIVYGLSLIVAFSIGLASALIAIALLALRARGVVDRRLGTRAAHLLPVLSAMVIVGFGLFFLTKGLLQVGA